jgi:hypothetical protein
VEIANLKLGIAYWQFAMGGALGDTALNGKHNSMATRRGQ